VEASKANRSPPNFPAIREIYREILADASKVRQENPNILLNLGCLSDLREIRCHTEQGIIFDASGKYSRGIRKIAVSLIDRLNERIGLLPPVEILRSQ